MKEIDVKLYYVQVPNDRAGEALIAEHDEVVTGVQGTLALSRSFGVGDAIVVMTLPDNVSPADVGLPQAELKMEMKGDQVPQEQEKTDAVLHVATPEPRED
jgi:hypothetical protein